MIIPDRRLIQVLIGLLGLAFAAAVERIFFPVNELFSQLWFLAFICFVVVAVTDIVRTTNRSKVEVVRVTRSSYALNAEAKVNLVLRNPTSDSLNIAIVDHYPPEVVAKGIPAEITVSGNQETVFEYRVLPIKRGEAEFGPVEIRVQSIFKFWRVSALSGASETVRIYPDFMAVSNLNFLVYEQQLRHIGAHQRQRRGQGSDFKQLREFQDGDELRAVDWKATSRVNKLISKEYQDERDQEIIFLLDTGRRMRAKDDLLSHFDHCINATLLTSYIALLAGDAVGFMTFAGQDRWMSPVKGKSNINKLLNGLYDLHSRAQASDLLEASEKLMLKHQKRSLIIVLTNVRDEDSDDLSLAVKLMSKKHLVMVACLREKVLDRSELLETSDLDATLQYVGVQIYLERRRKLIARLRGEGVSVADSPADQIHVALINEYMALKRAGRI